MQQLSANFATLDSRKNATHKNSFHGNTDGTDSDQSEDPVLITIASPRTRGGLGTLSKDRRYKDIWRDADMAVAVGLRAPGEDDWPPRDKDGSVPAWASEGSRGHRSKQCKPCAFYHSQGCQSGFSCSFCHLCPPREVQRRKRLRRRVAREQLARDQGWSTSLPEHIKSSISRQAKAPLSDCSAWATGANISIGSDGAPYPPSAHLQRPSIESMCAVTTAPINNIELMVPGSVIPLGLVHMIPGISMVPSSAMNVHGNCAVSGLPRSNDSISTSSNDSNCEALLPSVQHDDESGSPTPFRCVTDFTPWADLIQRP